MLRAKKNAQNGKRRTSVRMKMNTASCRNPGKSSYPLRRKKRLSGRHALNNARMTPRPRSLCPDGLPLQNRLTFAQTAFVGRDMIEIRRDYHNLILHIALFSDACSTYFATGTHSVSTNRLPRQRSVSYTHLTLPTIYSV